jgi:hypothetical protein
MARPTGYSILATELHPRGGPTPINNHLDRRTQFPPDRNVIRDSGCSSPNRRIRKASDPVAVSTIATIIDNELSVRVIGPRGDETFIAHRES